MYALDGVCNCPEFLMQSFAELAERGIRELADALPMPVGPELRTLGVVEEELTGVSLSLYEEELLTERLRWALASAKRGRSRLRAQVAELNESLTAAAEALRARQGVGCSCPPVDQPGPHQVGCPQAEVPGPSVDESADRLSRFFAPVAALREDPHDGPLHHDYRVGHDLPETGGA